MKAVFLSFALGLCGGAALATPPDKFNITPDEHAACDGDAATFCAYTYPDEDELLACMKANHAKLSRECAAVFIAGLKKRHIPL